MRTAARVTAGLAAVAIGSLLVASPALACGGLVGENGTIKLTRTSTLAAFHDGVERYVTSFEFSGTGESVGSIVPLPDIPTKVERGGDWTLQRLEREVVPAEKSALFDVARSTAGSPEVILETKVDALDITILKGGGDEVGLWARDHGFLLTPDAPEVLDFYSSRSQVFMAARFDAARAKALGQTSGDGTPIMLTIPTDAPWVPLRILSLGLDKSQAVDADVFLLTDQQPELLAGGPGLSLDRSEAASVSLLDDLRSDKGMGWVPKAMWFTYLHVGTTAGQLDYDLAVSPDQHTLPTLQDTGVRAPEAVSVSAASAGRSIWPLLLGLGLGGIVLVALLTRDRGPAVVTSS